MAQTQIFQHQTLILNSITELCKRLSTCNNILCDPLLCLINIRKISIREFLIQCVGTQKKSFHAIFNLHAFRLSSERIQRAFLIDFFYALTGIDHVFFQ